MYFIAVVSAKAVSPCPEGTEAESSEAKSEKEDHHPARQAEEEEEEGDEGEMTGVAEEGREGEGEEEGEGGQEEACRRDWRTGSELFWSDVYMPVSVLHFLSQSTAGRR